MIDRVEVLSITKEKFIIKVYLEISIPSLENKDELDDRGYELTEDDCND